MNEIISELVLKFQVVCPWTIKEVGACM